MEAYLKKLCFEYQVDEREVKELLARMARKIRMQVVASKKIYRSLKI